MPTYCQGSSETAISMAKSANSAGQEDAQGFPSLPVQVADAG